MATKIRQCEIGIVVKSGAEFDVKYYADRYVFVGVSGVEKEKGLNWHQKYGVAYLSDSVEVDLLKKRWKVNEIKIIE